MEINNFRRNEIREKHFMNILVVGNGFDLAHGLPTKYEKLGE